jgi:hypothetical protein
MKMSIYVWGCNLQGVEPDLEGFVHLHWVHPQPRKVTVGERTLLCQFGVCTFVYCHGAEVPVQAQKNKWASLWTENWFYLKLEGEAELCGELAKIDYVLAEYMMTDGCVAAVDAFRLLSRQQCTRPC